jgi:protein SCO1/2
MPQAVERMAAQGAYVEPASPDANSQPCKKLNWSVRTLYCPLPFSGRRRAMRFVLLLIICACSSKLQHLGHVPDFSLTSENGESFGSAQLKNHVWVANFIFTRCPMVCPAFTAKMAELHARSEQLQLVSFSVDPEFDTPQVLKSYAAAHSAPWKFLTGDIKAVERVVVDSMKQPMDKGAEPTALVHGTYFVLVDKDGDIRGFYPYRDEGVVEQIARDAAGLQ